MRRNQSNLFYRGTVGQEGHMSPASFHFSSFHQPQNQLSSTSTNQISSNNFDASPPIQKTQTPRTTQYYSQDVNHLQYRNTSLQGSNSNNQVPPQFIQNGGIAIQPPYYTHGTQMNRHPYLEKSFYQPQNNNNSWMDFNQSASLEKNNRRFEPEKIQCEEPKSKKESNSLESFKRGKIKLDIC